MTKVTATLTNKGLSLVVDGEPHSISSSHLSYDKIIEALRNKDYDAIPSLIDVKQAINVFTQGNVEVTDNEVLYKGQPMHNSLSCRMLDMLRLGLDISPMANFLERLMKNPSHRAVNELYDFMEACDLPITEDGRLICYKSVNDDYWDTHTGKTFLNIIGSIIEMDRNQVDDNPDRTCSAGLHVCSQKYGMYGRRLLHVAVCPSDVVSVPREYNSAKMRVCRYEVLKDVNTEGFKQFDNEPVYGASYDHFDNAEWNEDDDEYDAFDWNF